MLNNHQIKLVQTAVRAAGLRSNTFDGRYRILLRQYKQSTGQPVKSCKQLNNYQLDDLLAICEAHGWRMPGKSENHYRFKVATQSSAASFAQQSAIKYLAGDLCWNDLQLGGMLKRMTSGFASNVNSLSPAQACQVIESLKAILSREKDKIYTNLKEIQDDMEAVTDGKQAS